METANSNNLRVLTNKASKAHAFNVSLRNKKTRKETKKKWQ